MSMLTKPIIPYVETMLTYSCTLSCRWCTNYSDYGMKGGYVRWEDIKPNLDAWYDRVHIDCFGFMGGEPLLNPELDTWIREFRKNYPTTTIMIISNATLFMRNLWLLDTMADVGMVYLKFSLHQPNAEYTKQSIDAVLTRFNWQWLEEEKRWFLPGTILDFEIEDNLDRFTKLYRGEYGSMKPYNSNPIESHKICTQIICPLLYEGNLYKCSSVALLKRVLGDHNQLDDPDWQKYLNYNGIGVDCSDEDLLAWVNNFAKPADICSMCPTTADCAQRPHYNTVVSKIKIY